MSQKQPLDVHLQAAHSASTVPKSNNATGILQFLSQQQPGDPKSDQDHIIPGMI